MFRTLAATLVAFAILPQALAQQPAMPSLVRLVVPFSPGGSTDVLARAVAVQLGARLGSNVIVENRTGAGGLIGASAVAKGPRDGSMLLLATGSLATAVATVPNAAVDINADLQAIALVGEGPMVVAVSTRTGIRTPADLVAAARAKPDTLTFGSAGVGTIGHLTGELINDAAKIHVRHIPYKGTSLALVDLVSGTIDMTVAIHSSLAGQIKAGQVRLVAVTSQQANPSMPGVPPLSAAIPGFDATTWIAVFAPAGTPDALVQRLNREINEIARSKEVLEQLRTDGVIPMAITPIASAARIRESVAAWRRIAAAKKIVAE